MQSILLNIISNALKYRHPHRNPVIHIKTYEAAGVPWLEISDNGIGIDLENYGNKLFGFSNTFHDNPDARGVGLYTKAQIQAMGGKFFVQSNVNVGSEFKIMLAEESEQKSE